MNQLEFIKKVLVGPTASGKTDVAHTIAARSDAGIISADAMMVYQGMDIGTAKPGASDRARHVYAGIDLTTPDQPFSVHDYLSRVEQKVQTAKHTPTWMIVGGTGLYVRCLLQGLDGDAGADEQLRAEAGKVLEAEGMDALKAWCEARFPGMGSHLPPGDVNNPRRWIRAVERGGHFTRQAEIGPDVRIVGLRWAREALEKRIVSRVERMYAEGLLDEVVQLRAQYSRLSPTAEKAIGYQEAFAVLNQEMKVEEAKQRTVIRTRQYAKRQMTWFRHQLPVRWIDVSIHDTIESIAQHVEELWNEHG